MTFDDYNVGTVGRDYSDLTVQGQAVALSRPKLPDWVYTRQHPGIWRGVPFCVPVPGTNATTMDTSISGNLYST